MNCNPVLIVGTTPDYVCRISASRPSALFLLDERHRGNAFLERTDPSRLIFAPIADEELAVARVVAYGEEAGIELAGVACFDCEALLLACATAARIGKPFPEREGIIHARNKSASRRLWHEAGVPTPPAKVVSNPEDTVAFWKKAKRPVVLKPLSASGSELLFLCGNAEEVEEAAEIMRIELGRRHDQPLFAPLPPTAAAEAADPSRCWMVEEAVAGPEFSCDFLLQGDAAVILRETGKLRDPGQSFGSVMAYVLPPEFPHGFDSETLPALLRRAALALGFTLGQFMVDFILRDGRPVILELTPRPGGDSIPDLVAVATGRNMLNLHLDIAAEGFRFQGAPAARPGGSFASINLFAPRAGLIRALDTSAVRDHPRVRGVFLKKGVGDQVALPPSDYDNRLLGHVVASLDPSRPVEDQCEEVRGLFRIEVV
jgi:biotin carboxylase